MKKVNGILKDVTKEDLQLLKNDPKKFWSGVHTVGDLAFFKVADDLKEISIPNFIKRIEYGAFWRCYKLENVNLSTNLISIGEFAFFGCTSLKSIQITENVDKIHKHAFSLCENLNKIIIPKKLIQLDLDNFQGCENLEFINFNEGLLKKIGNYWEYKSDLFNHTFKHNNVSDMIMKINKLYLEKDFQEQFF